MQQIIALGGGGFSVEPENPLLDRYIINQSGKVWPSVCFLPQASGESREYIIKFYTAYNKLDCRASHLSLFEPHTADIEGFLMEQDIIYVGGGNTKSMLALWREWHLDTILLKACRNGTVLAGISAGANCWFEQCTTDSIPGPLTVMDCLGYLAGSCTPHYDGESERKPTVMRVVASGEMVPGFAFDNGAAGHFIDGDLNYCISSRPAAKAYMIDLVDGEVVQTTLDTNYLG